MVQIGSIELIKILWAGFIAYWLVAALSVKRMRTREPVAERLVYVGVTIAALYLLLSAPTRLLNARFVPLLPWLEQAGVLITAAGMAFAVWARVHIGKYWSASVSIREDHQLIRSGPYARIRHPIYTGILLAIAGTVLAAGTFRALAVWAAILAGFIVKAKKEERLLSREFGVAFEEHRSRTGFFLPKFS